VQLKNTGLLFNKGTQSVITLQFGSSFAVWQWTFPWLPGQNISVDTQQFLCNTWFYSPVSSVWLHKTRQSTLLRVIRSSSVDSVLAYHAGNSSSSPTYPFLDFTLFAFLSLFFHIREREEHSWFLNVKSWKYANMLQQWRFKYCWNSMEHIKLG
jgi:hypothetical protein